MGGASETNRHELLS